MKLQYYRGDVPNFGDELNLWLWSRLLPDFFDDDESTLFIGMGSVLYDHYPADATKLVFGTGYGGYTKAPKIDDTWKFYFVRGPRTAEVIGIDRSLGLGDPASLVGCIPEVKGAPRRPSGPAFMPHWESALYGAWERVAERAGVRYIDPRWPVERVLDEIASSSVLVSEAMHGAIVADALRVPWVPFAPISRHHAKWYDWADSLGFELAFAPAAPSSWLEGLTRLFDSDPRMQERLIYHLRKYDASFVNELFGPWAVGALKRASAALPQLSSDAAYARASSAMLEKLNCLRSDYPERAKPAPSFTTGRIEM